MKRLFTLVACTLFVLQAFSQTNQWTWVSGDNTTNSSAIYGTKGVGSTTNKPSARQLSISWTDVAGNLWLFGGNGQEDQGIERARNDLWRYSPSTNQWTWVSGDNFLDARSIYGTKGVANVTNKPGARHSAVSWSDAAGNLWLFGGYGRANGGVGSLNDLWKYTPSTDQWTWVSGDTLLGERSVYGSKGVPSSITKPGSRYNAVSWSDAAGNLWLFGGVGRTEIGSTNGTIGFLNDLWKYTPSTDQWTWVSGDSIANQPGVYGSKGVPEPANKPSARTRAVSWSDTAGNLWLLGGDVSANTPLEGPINDLWKYTPSTDQWTWVSGDSIANQPGVYGSKGVPEPANKPGARSGAVSWSDGSDNLWLFGGVGRASRNVGYFNDLWKYTPSTDQWTWVSGDSIANQPGVYGSKGVPEPANKPGARQRAISWSDKSGNFWLMSGSGYAANGSFGFLNDLWSYQPLSMPPPVCLITGGVERVCAGSTTTWSAPDGMDSYTWSGPNGFNATTKDITVSVAGTYTLTVSKGDAQASCSRTLSVNPTPVITTKVAEELFYCSGDRVPALQFSGSANQYFWSNDNPSIGLSTNGAGDLPAFLAINNGGGQNRGKIKVESFYIQDGLICQGDALSFTIVVKANPRAGITVSAATPQPSGSDPASTLGSSLTYQYYEGSWSQLPDFGGLKAVSTGTVSNVTLAPRKRDDQFAFLFQGKITIPKAGRYYFETSSDDGSRLYIGGWGHYVTPVVDNDGLHATLLRGGWYEFPQAGQYDFAVSFFEQGGEQVLNVLWGSDDAGIPMHTPIPDQAFAGNMTTPPPPSLSTLTYQYYEGSWNQIPDFGGLKAVASGVINNITLAPRRRDDQFAMLFQGKISIPKAGRYYFETASDEGSRLYIGGWGHYVTPVVINDGLHGTETKGGWYTFPSVGQYDFAVSYFEQTGDQQLQVYWSSEDASIPMHTPIPDQAFRTAAPPSVCGTYTLNASAGDSYLWSTGETTRSINVNPPGTYLLTLTVNGCSITTGITLNCPVPLSPGLTQQTPAVLELSSTATLLSLQVSPNPTTSQFNLWVQGLKQGIPAILLVSDALGRVIERRTISADGQLTLGANYRPGVYHLQLVQGNRKTMSKVVKLGN